MTDDFEDLGPVQEARLLPGGNNPPEPIQEAIGEVELARAAQLIEAGDRIPPFLEDAASASAATDFLGQVRSILGALKDAQRRACAPIEEQLRAERGRFIPVAEKLQAVAGLTQGRLTDWLKKQEPAPEAKKGPRARGSYGQRAVTLRETKTVQVVDHAKALKFYKEHPFVKDAVQKAASADARRAGGPEAIPGCEITIERKAV
jgi:hypothetical protein